MSRANLAALAALMPSPGVPGAGAVRLGFGVGEVDDRLGGGLPVAAVHELYASGTGDAAAPALALLLALRNGRAGPIVWVGEDKARAEGRLYGLGLVELGIDPARLVLVEAPDTLGVLHAGADAVACAGVAAVVLAAHGKAAAFDLTATRRLALAAARSGVTVLLLRHGEPAPSAAHSRWQVAAAPSTRFGADAPGRFGADAPGRPAFALTLLRHRAGIAGFSCFLEWDRDQGVFAAPDATPDIGAAPAAAAVRAGAAPGVRRRAA